jgi:hypothetical protein
LKRIRSFFSPRNLFEYCAKIYYTGILPFQFDFEFIIIRDLDTLAEAIEAKLRKRDSKLECGPSSKVEFEENEISLNIPTRTCGWTMTRLNKPLVRREDVDNYTPRRVLMPCQVKVCWGGDRDDPVKPLSHEIKLVGAKNVYDFLTVTSPILCIDAAVSSPVRSFTSSPQPRVLSGTESTQYGAVLNSLEDITTAIKATPEVKESVLIKFKMKQWIKPTTACSEAELAECALEKVRQDPEQFPILLEMFRDTVGMDIIAKKLEQI